MSTKTLEAMASEAMAIKRATQLRLPLWEPPRRAMPTDFVRSALFTARRERDNGEVQRKVIPCDTAVLEYKGPVLNQSHADVWENILFVCRMSNATQVTFHANALINLMREVREETPRQVQTADRQRLLKRIDELSAGHVFVKHNDGAQTGATLLSYHRKTDDRYRVSVDPDVVKLFWDDHVLLDWAVRAAIKGELAKWLQSYFAATLDPVHIARIRELSSSTTKSDIRFRQAVKDALAELVRVKALTAWGVKQDYALVTNKPDRQLPRLPAPKP